MSISEEEIIKKGYLLTKKNISMQDYQDSYVEDKQKVLKNDNDEESLKSKSLQDFNRVDSIELKHKINNNSVETSLNMKSGNETLNLSKKEFNNGSVIKEQSTFKKPESVKERQEIVKELKKDGYTQQEIADRMGYSQSTISRDDRANNKKRKS